MKKASAVIIFLCSFLFIFTLHSEHTHQVYGNSANKGEITASLLNVRESPSTSAPIIARLSKGTSINLNGENGQWYQVQVGSRTGYIHSDYVKVTHTSSESASTEKIGSGEVTASRLNVRASASTSSSVIGSLSNGTTVDLYEDEGSWYKVRVNGNWGYVHKDYVKRDGSSNGSGSSTDEKIGSGEVTASRLNVRASASTSSSIIGSLSNGTSIDLYEDQGSWYKVRVNGNWGYVHKDYVKRDSSSNGSGSSTDEKIGSGEVTASRLNVRASVSTSSSVIGSLSNGTSIDLYGEEGSWYKVRVNGNWGYVHKDYVKRDSSSNGSGDSTDEKIGSGEVTASRLNVRASASTGSSIIGSLSNGTTVDLYGEEGSWYKVRVNGNWGYVHKDYVKRDGSSNGSGSSTDEKIGSGEVTASRLNVRASASTNSSIVGSLSRGAMVDIYEEQGSWYKINFNNDYAFVHKDYITKGSGNSPNPGNVDLSGKTIFLDPGHGGNDSGAYVNGVKESDIAIGISSKLKSQLEAAGATIVTSRTTDKYVSLNERVSQANNSGADLFISLHANSFSTSQASGAEVFYNSVNRGSDSRSLALAIQNRLVNDVGFRDRSAKESNFQVIRYTHMASVLVEAGFMTNSSDLNKLVNNQDEIAQAIFNGIADYYN
ncbi:SH3 domain-containing protein [Evansella halocellulosilytica]|uniref:SH3 domain-containing protein n=1 Tax=Evansella halocellulosilytica TaxID=2011013 RepID=UPI000BB6F50D|nr:SH3 domain-containing protein [Evansella halocellulosilytica]